MEQVIDAGNSVPLYLAALHFGAKQLQETCKYWMAMNYSESERNAQWDEVPADVKAGVKSEHERLLAEREKMRQVRVMMQNVQCLLAPSITAVSPL